MHKNRRPCDALHVTDSCGGELRLPRMWNVVHHTCASTVSYSFSSAANEPQNFNLLLKLKKVWSIMFQILAASTHNLTSDYSSNSSLIRYY